MCRFFYDVGVSHGILSGSRSVSGECESEEKKRVFKNQGGSKRGVKRGGDRKKVEALAMVWQLKLQCYSSIGYSGCSCSPASTKYRNPHVFFSTYWRCSH